MIKRDPVSDEYLNFGNKLKSIRLSKKLTQSEIAKKMGVSKTTVLNYEMGTRKIPLSYLVQFSKLFNVSVDEILGTGHNPIENLTNEEFAELLKYANYLISRRG